MSIRDDMVALAKSVVGLSANPAHGRDDFCALVGPGETPAVAADLATLSTCGLTVRGLWGRIGMKDARLSAPYAPGSVITNIRNMATEAGGWSTDVSTLDLGDVILISEPDHVGTIVKIDPRAAGGVNITTVDGGSKDAAGYQCVVSFERAIGADGSILAGPLSGNGRKLLGIASLPAVAAAFGAGNGSGGASSGAGGASGAAGESQPSVLPALVLLAGLGLAWRIARGRWI